jgi:type II secretory pathway pseudopilin PulG
MVRIFPIKCGGAQRTSALRDCRAFSLIELLVVLNIMAYLVWFAAPALFSILTGQGVSEAAYDFSSAVEQARNEAVTRRTYVWLAMQEEVREGNLGLRIGAVRSKDGKANTNSSNLVPIGKPLLISHVGLIEIGLPSTNVVFTTAPTNGAVDLTDALGGVRFQIGKVSFDQGRTITFMPMGEATTNPVPSSSSGFDPLMLLSLRQTYGTKLKQGNDISVAIDGSVGTPVIYRNR